MSIQHRMVLNNPLKRNDIFRCTHQAHTNFDFSVSVNHVLKEKKCFPEGCIDFKWFCSSLKKENKCHRGFTSVGKECDGCRYFDEEKLQRIPKLLLSSEKYKNFIEHLDEFESYFVGNKQRYIEFSGIIEAVKPFVVENRKPYSRRFDGFILQFDGGYFGIDSIEDRIYTRIGSGSQQRFRFIAGDDLDFKCFIGLNKGRIALSNIKGVRFNERGEGYLWNTGKAKVAVSSGKFLDIKLDKCYKCQMGILVDSAPQDCDEKRRRIFCLQGVENPQECVYKIYKQYMQK
ncbi:MAG: hypothetical protein GY855_07515 [candidate division Zixibacteria bacterium]|nr:hypothetical protein [candidate division Zixibacteria bacterium]